MMPASTTGGMATEFAIDVRKKDGSLFYHEATIKSPELPAPPQFPDGCVNCIDKYKADLDFWVAYCKKEADLFKAIHDYHSARTDYCMKHRNDEIDEKYITGEPSPQTIEEAKKEITKLRR